MHHLFITLHKNFTKSALGSPLSVLFVSLFIYSKNYCKADNGILGSNRTVTRNNRFKFRHDWVNLFDSGGIFTYLTRASVVPQPMSSMAVLIFPSPSLL